MFTAQIVARLKEDEERYVRSRAAREDRSISSVIRCLVSEAMKSEQVQQRQAAA
jgi:plasmid stability protein